MPYGNSLHFLEFRDQANVGVDLRTEKPESFECILEGKILKFNHVGQNNGWGSRNSFSAMNQHIQPAIDIVLNGIEYLREIMIKVFLRIIVHFEILVQEFFGKLIGQIVYKIHNDIDFARGEQVFLASRVVVAEE